MHRMERLRRLPRNRELALVFALALSGAGTLFAGGGSVKAAAEHVRNFGEVEKNLYRGGEPTAVGLEELGAMGVKLVVDLRESGEGTASEKLQVERLGMRYVNVPFQPFSAPETGQVERVLGLLAKSDKEPVFLHCRRGKDRTGTVIACYRIQHDGWTNEKALAEARDYGMSSLEKGMRNYILHFVPPPPVAPALTVH